MRILGVDPGLNVTGYAVIEKSDPLPKICEAGVVRPTTGRDTTELAPRLLTLYNSILEIIDQYKPDAVSVEQLFSHYEHPRTAILMGHARGVILLAGAMRGISVYSYAATQIKKVITGNGRASKEQMQYTMLREFGLPKMPEPHDVADALAISLCHYYIGRLNPTDLLASA